MNQRIPEHAMFLLVGAAAAKYLEHNSSSKDDAPDVVPEHLSGSESASEPREPGDHAGGGPVG